MSNASMTVGPEYFRLIGHFERGKANDPNCRLTASGAALDAYLCPAGVPTIGAGSIKRLDGSAVQMGDTITEEEVFLLAERDAEDAMNAVRKIQRPLLPHQFDALTSFTQNLGEGNFRKLAPLIEEGRWEDAAEKMSEYVRAWGKYEGRWYFMALLGLRIRRFAEGLLLNGYEWADVCNPDDIGMPKQRPPQWQPDGTAKDGTRGRYFDVLLPGATEYTTLEAAATKLPAPELVLSQPAPPIVAPEVTGSAVGGLPKPPPAASSAHVNETAKTEHDTADVSKIPPKVSTPAAVPPVGVEKQAPVIPAPSAKPAPAPYPPAPAGGVIVTAPPKPPVVIAPKQIDPRAAPYGEILPDSKPKNMTDSARVIGLVIVGIGSIVQVLSAREIISTTIGAVFYDLSRDSAFVAMAAGGAAMFIGWLTRKRGTHIVAKGMVNARALLK